MGLGSSACLETMHIYYEPWYRAQMEPPAEHLRGMETGEQQLENVGGNVWLHAIAPYPGLAERWTEIAGEQDPREAFVAAYVAYIRDAGRLYQEKPEQYNFLKEAVFEGRQYMDVWEAIQAHRCAEAIAGMPELAPEAWERLDESEKIAALSEVERRLAGIQGRPPAEVIGMPLAGWGQYEFQSGRLYVNNSPDSLANARETIGTVIHEGRHAYQDYAIHHPGFHHDDADVAEWTTNARQYMDAGLYGYELYKNQPLESDAFLFEEAVRNALFGKVGR